MDDFSSIRQLLFEIYGEQKGREAADCITSMIDQFAVRQQKRTAFFSEEDVVLITYGDTLQKQMEPPLRTFLEFAGKRLADTVSAVHFLPFFPFSSDDGFSVIDYYTIDPCLGVWDDVSEVGTDFKLMFDFVINHFSARSQWFGNYLNGVAGFEDMAIEASPDTDLSQVVRPRALPLLTPFQKADGRTAHVWTTFSADQIDFNFNSVEVLVKMVEVLLFYIEKGASILRLDAIAYLWKKEGTSCVHLRETHLMVQLLRGILDLVAPDAILITETNVPHAENISYFGDGRNEAQMVYNFTLPPLLLHTFIRQDATVLSRWAKGLASASDAATFFNFTASHDGIGVRPLEGILPAEDIEYLVQRVKANGGQVSYKRNTDGSDSPYELNISYVDAIMNDTQSDDPRPFLASQAIQYTLPGVPATYIHSLLGSRNWMDGVAETKRARTINREKLNVNLVEGELNDTSSFRSRIFYPYCAMIQARRRQPAFHPNASFEIMDSDPGIFAIRRHTAQQTIYALTNVTARPILVNSVNDDVTAPLTDILTGSHISPAGFRLKPYEYVWLTGSTN
ncbi:MAG: sugar phosphorylase [Desulfobacteraceae bacterium]|nr:sugar phosphorylase [Desulfobacteraceae bacterium]